MSGGSWADGVKAAQRTLYASGTYDGLSAALAPVAAVLVDAAGVSAGARVLDAGAGDGNVALAAARAGAEVVACDLSPEQVERGRRRTGAAGLDVGWVEADVEALPFADASFDAVLSAFAAVFAPRPERAAAELFRVARTGGVVALTAWPPDSYMGELTAAVRAVAPPGAVEPELEWGVEAVARERFRPFAADVDCSRHALRYDLALRQLAGEDDFARRYVTSLLGADARERAGAAFRELNERYALDERATRADYLLVVGRRAG